MLKRGVDGDKPFGAAPDEQARILFNEVGFVAVVRAEIEVAFPHEVIAYAAHDQGVVAIAQFGNHDTDGERTLLAERPRQKTRLIIKLARGCAPPLAGLVGDGASRNVVECNGNRSGGEAEIVGQYFQTDRFVVVDLFERRHRKVRPFFRKSARDRFYWLHKHSSPKHLSLNKNWRNTCRG